MTTLTVVELIRTTNGKIEVDIQCSSVVNDDEADDLYRRFSKMARPLGYRVLKCQSSSAQESLEYLAGELKDMAEELKKEGNSIDDMMDDEEN